MGLSHNQFLQPSSQNNGEEEQSTAPEDIYNYFQAIAERKQAEEQLQFQATILRHVTDCVVVTDPQGTIMYWNEGAHAIFGYTAQEMLGKSTALLYPEIDMTQFAYDFHLKRILAGNDYVGEWKGRRKDGTEVWVDRKATVLRDTRGKVIGLIGVAKDITARKQAEERLSWSEKHFRALIEHIADGIVLTDANGIITYVSSSSTRLTGFSPEEFVGHRVFQRMVYPDDQEATRRLLARVLKEPGKSQVLEYRTRRKDGTYFWIETVGINFLDEPGVEAIVWNFRDITQRKQLTEEVARAKEQLETILHNVADSIVVVDANNNLVYINDVAARIGGFPSAAAMLAAPRPAIAESLSRFVTWDERGRPLPFEERPSSQALRGKKAHALVLFQDTVTGKKYWTLVRAQPIFDAQGQVQFMVSVSTDITEQKELEQRKDHFISMASHELKTPLTILSVYTQLLREQFEAEDRQDVVLQLSKMDDQITNLTKLVVDLLDISRIQAGQLELAQEAVDMDELVCEVVENLQSTTTHHLLIEGAARQTITGDRNRLEQVLMNLLTNAIKYSPRADRVVVRVTHTDDALTVSVQDFGIGIAQSHQPRLFERFYRVYSEKDQTYPGLGIGLYIAYEIVQRHGGKMWVESVEGQGSTFSFSLPIR
jgi:two-component system, OmpR family, phosphate regulon sensor histidine kinase PhoR